jgi:hypothetical protein
MPRGNTLTKRQGKAMKNLLVASFAAVLWLAGPAFAQEAKQDFKLVNKTGYELKEVYVGPTKSDDWGDDIMGDDAVADGATVNVHFHPKAGTCHWDLKVVYSDDDSSAIWYDINLCEVERITLHYDRKKDVTRASFD